MSSQRFVQSNGVVWGREVSHAAYEQDWEAFLSWATSAPTEVQQRAREIYESSRTLEEMEKALPVNYADGEMRWIALPGVHGGNLYRNKDTGENKYFPHGVDPNAHASNAVEKPTPTGRSPAAPTTTGGKAPAKGEPPDTPEMKATEAAVQKKIADMGWVEGHADRMAMEAWWQGHKASIQWGMAAGVLGAAPAAETPQPVKAPEAKVTEKPAAPQAPAPTVVAKPQTPVSAKPLPAAPTKENKPASAKKETPPPQQPAVDEDEETGMTRTGDPLTDALKRAKRNSEGSPEDYPQQLAFAFEDYPEAAAGLRPIMLKAGMKPLNKIGEIRPFNGIYHKTEDDVLPGDPVRVVHEGWAYPDAHTKETETLSIIRTLVESAPGKNTTSNEPVQMSVLPPPKNSARATKPYEPPKTTQSITPEKPATKKTARPVELTKMGNEVLQAMQKLRDKFNYIDLADIKKALPHLSIPQFHGTMQSLRQVGKIALHVGEGRHGISDEQQQVGIPEEGDLFTHASLKDKS